jgi:SPP1 family predicted phage head-tail adaptor
MSAGARDHRITLLRKTAGKDAFGGEIEAWAPLCPDVWASKTDLRDAERIRAQQVGAVMTTRFVIGWSPETAALDAGDQVACEGKRYAISGVKDLGTRRDREITAAVQSERSAA